MNLSFDILYIPCFGFRLIVNLDSDWMRLALECVKQNKEIWINIPMGHECDNPT